MSTIPKDEIPQTIKDAIRDYADCRDRKDAVISDVIYGYQLATDGREESHIQNFKNMTERCNTYHDQITALQSSLKEKENMIELLASEGRHQSESIYKYHLQLEEIKAENERLNKENEYYLKDLKRLDGLYGNLK